MHQPAWIGVLFAFIRPIMPAKIRQRIALYGRNYEGVTSEFGELHVPERFRGKAALDSKQQAVEALRLVGVGFPHLAEEVEKMVVTLEAGSDVGGAPHSVEGA